MFSLPLSLLFLLALAKLHATGFVAVSSVIYFKPKSAAPIIVLLSLKTKKFGNLALWG